MLRDPLLSEASAKIIKSKQINAEQALEIQSQNLISVFDQMEDPYLRNKRSDVQHITNALLRCLLGIVSHSLEEANEEDLTGKIIISKDLTPAETMFIKEKKVCLLYTSPSPRDS